MENIIVLTALYILAVALFYAPKCPAQTATESAPIDYVDYFPEVVSFTDDLETVDSIGKADKLDPAMGIPLASDTAIAANPIPSLANLSIRQLKALAKGKIKNYGTLTKSQLITALA